MSVIFSSIRGVARDSPAPLLAPPLTRGVARRAELTSAQKANEHLGKGGGGGREIAQLRAQLAEAQEESAMAKVQVARALTLAGRSPRSSTEHGRDGVDMLASLEASEQQVREGLTLTLSLTPTPTPTPTPTLTPTPTPTLTLTLTPTPTRWPSPRWALPTWRTATTASSPRLSASSWTATPTRAGGASAPRPRRAG